jgi:hypothetical protein
VNAPPSIALALMAWHLAQIRTLPFMQPGLLRTPTRRSDTDEYTRVSNEYYHILRRLEDGEQP